MSDKTSNYLKGASVLAAAGILSRLLGLFFKIPLYQMVGSYGNGIYANVTNIYNLLLMVSTVGIPLAISKMVAENIAKGEYKTAHRVFKLSMMALVVMGGLSSLFLLFGADWIIETANWTSESYPAIIAIAPAPLIISVCSAYRGFFQGFQIMTPTAVSQIVEQIVRVILGVLLCWIFVSAFGIGMGVGGAVFGATVGGLVAAVFLSYLYKSFAKQNHRLLRKRTGRRQRSNKALLKRLLIISIPVTLTSALVSMFATVDSFIYVSRLGLAGFDAVEATMMFGDFSNAEQLINLPLILSGTLAIAMIPTISESFALRDRKETNKKIVLSIRIILLLAFPSCIGLSVLSFGIFDLLFPGSPYGGAILSTLSYATIFMMLSNTFQSILQSIDRFRVPLINLGVAIIIRFVTGWIFLAIPAINIYGIVISSIITFAYLTVANFLSVRRFTGVEIDFFHTLIKPLFAALIMGLATSIVFKGVSSFAGIFLGLLVAMAVGVCVYGVIMILIKGITEEEIGYLPGNRYLMVVYDRINGLVPGRNHHRR
ncbi:putative polysaccharide biosynthesis protein [Acetobacterium bakii]|uniref:Polysaccharide biosynthesis protein n=1 Tax=Acetobacterium bakii TaxID=52689 RepID=A0A0L6U4D3_9FIRM|nr:polysaccharide biosynthesis protein [Acetobacterium bakii]KNZ43212.1 polysaccharide biosynthesis protein [Acetobacterium bakii]